jgi:hypothetical protein
MTNVLRRGLDKAANSEGRNLGHVGAGVLLVGAALLLTAAASKVADREFIAENGHEEEDGVHPPFSAMWTPLFLAVAASVIRVWNARRGPRRSAALTLWALVQALNAAWMTLGPRRFGGGTPAALITTLVSLAYLRMLEVVDRRAAAWVSPFVGWRSLAVIGLESARQAALQHREPEGPTPVTVH